MISADHAFEKYIISKAHLNVEGYSLPTYSMNNLILSLRETNY
jgi:hypothetical protein